MSLDPVNALLKGFAVFTGDIGNLYQPLHDFLVVCLRLPFCTLLVAVDDFHLQGEGFLAFFE